MKALVTGSTGFLGANIVRELLKDNIEVRVLVRKNSNRSNLSGLDVEIVEGDLNDIKSLELSLTKIDVLYHAAADYRLWTKNPQEMYESNVEGTKKILSVALAKNVSKVVYTSSVGTLGNIGDGTPGTETTPVTIEDMVGHYKKSKFLAEKEAQKAAENGLSVVIVNPSTPRSI